MRLTTLSSALLALVSTVVADYNYSHEHYGHSPIPSDITKDWLLHSAANSSLFTRWRPRSHFIAPAGWQNDPAGAIHDPTTDTYHLHYQFHHNHATWGNISWGHAVSKDLFHWTDIRDWVNDSSVSLAAGAFKAAPLSVFTGSSQPVNLKGEVDGTLLVLATGIDFLPTNWKKVYEPGTERQFFVESSDGGDSWHEVGAAPAAFQGPPNGWNVTGFRDPYLFPSPELDKVRNEAEPHYYVVLGSGLKGPDVPLTFDGAERPGFLGPRIPLYAAPASDLTDWTFLGALWEPAANTSLGDPDITGSYGYNFEVSGLFDLPIANDSHSCEAGGKAWFLTTGAEGGNTTRHWREQWALWNRASLTRRDDGSVELTPTSGGALDWGLAYAHATFQDTRPGNNDRRVVWNWAAEDISAEWNYVVAKVQGYAGSIGLPLELFVKETSCVRKHDFVDGNEWFADTAENGSFVAQTLGIRPLPEVLYSLKAGSDQETLTFPVIQAGAAPHRVDKSLGESFVLSASLHSPPSNTANGTAGTAGIIIAQSPGDEEQTHIVYDGAAQTISVVRTKSSSLTGVFNEATHEGHFTPYVAVDGTVENVDFTIVYDRSLLEVYVNDRFVLTSRIYPVRNDSTGLSLYLGDDAKRFTWQNVEVWKGLAHAWEGRPADSSSPLLWDNAEDTANYTRWDGW